MAPFQVWTWLERTAPAPTGTWPTEDQRLAGARAHFLRVVEPDVIEVEYLNGDHEAWPLALCRVVGKPPQ